MLSALRLQLKPSALLAALMSLLHGAALFLAVLLPLPAWSRILIVLSVLGSAIHALGKALLKTPTSPSVLSHDVSGQWLLVLRNGEELPAQLVHSFAHPWLVTLCFRYGGWRRNCFALLPDALSEAD